MSRRVLLPALAALASFVLAASTSARLPVRHAQAARAQHDSFGSAMLRELNRVRARHRLAAVRLDERMSAQAQAHSRDMAEHGYFAHGTWSGRVARAAGHAHSVGEVLGWLARTSPRREASQVVHAWLRSPTHREVVLNGGFRRIGIGREIGALASTQAAIYTVDFASAR